MNFMVHGTPSDFFAPSLAGGAWHLDVATTIDPPFKIVPYRTGGVKEGEASTGDPVIHE